MTRKKLVLLFASGILTGMFIVPLILSLLGLPSLDSALYFVFGEPSIVTIVIIIFIIILIISPIVRFFYKEYKKV